MSQFQLLRCGAWTSSPRACEKCRCPGPSPDLLTEKLCRRGQQSGFEMPCRWCSCSQKPSLIISPRGAKHRAIPSPLNASLSQAVAASALGCGLSVCSGCHNKTAGWWLTRQKFIFPPYSRRDVWVRGVGRFVFLCGLSPWLADVTWSHLLAVSPGLSSVCPWNHFLVFI